MDPTLEDTSPPNKMYKFTCIEKLNAADILEAFCNCRKTCTNCLLYSNDCLTRCLKNHHPNKSIEILKQHNLIVEVKE